MSEPLPDKERRGPWRRLSRDGVYDNPWISVYHDQVTTPAGTSGTYGVVHFKSRAVGIVPIDDDGYTWLVRQFRYTLNQPLWEIPMGGAPLNEAPADCARRELIEEVGLAAGRLDELMRLHLSKSVTDEQGLVFLARDLRAVPTALEPTEADLERVRLPFAEAVRWAMDGRITDVVSIAGLLKADALRRAGTL